MLELNQRQKDEIFQQLTPLLEKIDGQIYLDVLKNLIKVAESGFLESLIKFLEEKAEFFPTIYSILMGIHYRFYGVDTVHIYTDKLYQYLPQYDNTWQGLFFLIFMQNFEEDWKASQREKGLPEDSRGGDDFFD